VLRRRVNFQVDTDVVEIRSFILTGDSVTAWQRTHCCARFMTAWRVVLSQLRIVAWSSELQTCGRLPEHCLQCTGDVALFMAVAYILWKCGKVKIFGSDCKKLKLHSRVKRVKRADWARGLLATCSSESFVFLFFSADVKIKIYKSMRRWTRSHVEGRTQTEGYWGECLHLRGMEWPEAGEDWRSVICTLHRVSLEDEVVLTCSSHGGR
jgi:hypothetical protein